MCVLLLIVLLFFFFILGFVQSAMNIFFVSLIFFLVDGGRKGHILFGLFF